MASPLAPVAELAVKAEKGISVTVTQESEISEAAPPPVADLAYAEAEVVAETTATPPPAVSSLTTADKPSGPALVAQERSGGIPPAQNPFPLWRILEGVTAITALTFLVMWLLRRRTKR